MSTTTTMSFFRVEHSPLVWVRSSPHVSGEVVGRRWHGDALIGLSLQDGWVRCEEGWILVDGTKLGFGILLKNISRDEFEAAKAESDRKRKEIGEAMRRAVEAGCDKDQVVKEMARRELVRLHHVCGKTAKGEPSQKCLLAESMISRASSQLNSRGLAIVDDFFSFGEEARTEMIEMDHRLKETIQTTARDDRIGWFKQDDLGPALSHVLQVQKGLAAALGRWKEKTLENSQSVMISCYPPGGSYCRHADNSKDEDGENQNPRALTAIFYAQPSDWSEEDGGHLRFFLDDEVVEVLPCSNRFVIFDAFIQHQVLPPTRRARYAQTFWIYFR